MQTYFRRDVFLLNRPPRRGRYLEELEAIELTVETAGKFNFVAAAMVVQGSTHVYSRKVRSAR